MRVTKTCVCLDSLKLNLMSSTVRLNRFLASCGLASRRACEKIILEGRVTVNGEPAVLLSTKVDPESDIVKVDSYAVKPEAFRYFLFNKPKGVICSSRDERGRKTCIDFLPEDIERVYTVGRLDRDSEGLVLLTNDGNLAHKLTHPSFEHAKLYLLWMDDALDAHWLRRFSEGIEDDGEMLKAFLIKQRDVRTHCYEVILKEGRNRQLRRMTEAAGREVVRLQRIEMGSLVLKDVSLGECRELSDEEALELKAVT